MKSLVVVVLSVCCLVANIKAVAVEPVVEELQKDDSQNSSTETMLTTNEDCIHPKETGRCFALFNRFAYDLEKRECVEFVYGGCGGNSNNFETKKECEEKCMQNVDNSATELNTTAVPDTDSETTTQQISSSSK